MGGYMFLLSLVLLQSLSRGKGRSRCLLLSIDNRPLNQDVHSNHYPTVTALLNREYASFHGYDYLQLVNEVDDLEKSVHAKYTKYDAIPPTDNAKDAATAFHVGLHQFRAASWAKLPPLWDITRKFGSQYDLIFYIDSDAVISPFHRNQSLDDLLDKWQDRFKTTPPLKGQRDLTNATFIFFNNFPWRDDMPCAGTFIFRPTPHAEAILRQWWDFSGIPDRNFKHFHEQDALWHMVDGDQRGKVTYLMTSSFAILGERQFPSAWQRFESLWLVHIASYNYLMRNPILNIFMKALELHDEKVYKARLALIKLHKVAALAVCEDMEARSTADPNRIPLGAFPVYSLSNESHWWNMHVSSNNVERPSVGEQFEGRLVTRKGEFWLVLNGTRRGFPSYEAFLKVGFENDMAFPLTLAQVRSIPEGDRLPGVGASGGEPHPLFQRMVGRSRGAGRKRAVKVGAEHDVDMR